MCSELFRIPYEIAGVPLFGFGVLLAIWAITSGITIAGMVRQYGWGAETWSTLPTLLFLGVAIYFLPRVFPNGLPIRGYGVMLLAGISAGVGMALYRARQAKLDREVIFSLAIWLVIFGVLGARLFHVVEYWNESFAGRPPIETLLKIVNIPDGGLVVYGALFGAAIGFVIFVRKNGLPLLALADIAAPSMAIGLALGRIGCFMNGCCYGGHTDLPWAVTFPKYSSRLSTGSEKQPPRYSPPYGDQAARGEMLGFRIDSRAGAPAVVASVQPGSAADTAGLKAGDRINAINGHAVQSLDKSKLLLLSAFENERGVQIELKDGRMVRIPPASMPARSLPVHPTQIYSAIDAGLLGWLLWSFFPFRRRDGEAVALLLTVHPISRFLLEIIRTDEPAVFGTGMSISQNISIVLFLCGVALWWHLSKQPRGIAWPIMRGPIAGKAPATSRASARVGRT
jgi:phosphatidylglycerol:prolipoprotein diacylglycerol transferase